MNPLYGNAGPGAGRAIRLGANERIAPFITRRGRFRTLDPSRPRPLPRFSKILGVVGWGGLLGFAFLKAVRTNRAE